MSDLDKMATASTYGQNATDWYELAVSVVRRGGQKQPTQSLIWAVADALLAVSLFVNGNSGQCVIAKDDFIKMLQDMNR